MKNTDGTELAVLKTKLEIYEKLYEQDSSSRNIDDFDLKELWQVIWQGKWKILVITILFAIGSVFYALSLPNVYKSDVLLMPNSQDGQQGGLGALAGQFGGLASLAGINLSGGNTSKTEFALELLRSRVFLYQFFKENDLKPEILAAKSWNLGLNKIVFDEDIYNEQTKTWVRKVKPPKKAEPSLFEAYEEFLNENLSILEDKDTGLIRLSVSHYSPYLAQELVVKLVNSINQTIKQQDMDEAIKSIKYFESELENTKLADSRSMFYQLIEQQQQTLMLTKVRNDYVFKTIDSPVVAEKKYKPARALICILGTLFGSMFASLIVLIRYFLKK